MDDLEKEEEGLTLSPGEPDLKQVVSILVSRLGPSCLEALIGVVDRDPDFYEVLCEAFENRYPTRAGKLFGRTCGTELPKIPASVRSAVVIRSTVLNAENSFRMV